MYETGKSSFFFPFFLSLFSLLNWKRNSSIYLTKHLNEHEFDLSNRQKIITVILSNLR